MAPSSSTDNSIIGSVESTFESYLKETHNLFPVPVKDDMQKWKDMTADIPGAGDSPTSGFGELLQQIADSQRASNGLYSILIQKGDLDVSDFNGGAFSTYNKTLKSLKEKYK